jgi:hypothetical protein
MANVRTTDKDARLIKQLADGKYTRYVASQGFIIALARTNNTPPNRIMADVIKNETEVAGFFVAPCACKVVRIAANGTPFVDMATSGTVTAKLTKAVIGGSDVDLCSTIGIGAATVPTADTCIDATLSSTAGALDLLVGQHVFATIAVSNHDVETAVAYVTLMMEWYPTDKCYASS